MYLSSGDYYDQNNHHIELGTAQLESQEIVNIYNIIPPYIIRILYY